MSELSYVVNIDVEAFANELAKTHKIPDTHPFYNLFYDRKKGLLVVEFQA